MELPLASLLSTCRQLERAWKLDEILGAVGPVIDAELGYPHCHLALVGERPGFVTVISHQAADANPYDDSNELLRKSQSIDIPIEGDAMLQEILASDHIVVVEDARTDPRTNKEVVAALENRTLINVPLILADRTLGVLGLGTFTDAEGIRPPQPWHLEFLTLLAGHVAVALDRVRIAELHAKAQQDRLQAVLTLSGQVAHELNTPLGAILSCVRSIRADLAPLSADVLRAFCSASPDVQDAYLRLSKVLGEAGPAPLTRPSNLQWRELCARHGLTANGLPEVLESIRFPADWEEGWRLLRQTEFQTLLGHLATQAELLLLGNLIAHSAEQASGAVTRLRALASTT